MSDDGMKLRFSDRTLDAIERLAERSGYSPKEIICLGIAVLKVVIDAQQNGNSIIETTPAGTGVTSIVLPEPQAVIDTVAREVLGEPYSASLESAIADLDPDLAPAVQTAMRNRLRPQEPSYLAADI